MKMINRSVMLIFSFSEHLFGAHYVYNTIINFDNKKLTRQAHPWLPWRWAKATFPDNKCHDSKL